MHKYVCEAEIYTPMFNVVVSDKNKTNRLCTYCEFTYMIIPLVQPARSTDSEDKAINECLVLADHDMELGSVHTKGIGLRKEQYEQIADCFSK